MNKQYSINKIGLIGRTIFLLLKNYYFEYHINNWGQAIKIYYSIDFDIILKVRVIVKSLSFD